MWHVLKCADKAEYLIPVPYIQTQRKMKKATDSTPASKQRQTRPKSRLTAKWIRNEDKCRNVQKQIKPVCRFFFSTVSTERDWISMLWRCKDTIFEKKKLLIEKGRRSSNYNAEVEQKKTRRGGWCQKTKNKNTKIAQIKLWIREINSKSVTINQLQYEICHVFFSRLNIKVVLENERFLQPFSSSD